MKSEPLGSTFDSTDPFFIALKRWQERLIREELNRWVARNKKTEQYSKWVDRVAKRLRLSDEQIVRLYRRLMLCSNSRSFRRLSIPKFVSLIAFTLVELPTYEVDSFLWDFGWQRYGKSIRNSGRFKKFLVKVERLISADRVQEPKQSVKVC